MLSRSTAAGTRWRNSSVAVCALLLAGLALAHGDESAAGAAKHSDDSAQLQIDKSEQRRLGLRTQPLAQGGASLSLPAQVVVDPRRRLLLCANQSGILHAPAAGFVEAGRHVAAGAVLASLQPVLPEPERRDLEGDRAIAHRDVELGRTQIKRYGIDMAQKFDVQLPTPSLQVVLDYRTAQAREKHFGEALDDRLPLQAPAAAVVLRSLVRSGSAVAAGQPLFELSLDGGTAIELQLAESGLDPSNAQLLSTGTAAVTLNYLGAAYDPQARLQRAYYSIPAVDRPLSVGEPVALRIRQRAATEGTWLLPASAVAGDGSQAHVWLHRLPQVFEARTVTVTPAADGWVQVAGALDADDRVVIEGAAQLEGRARQQALRASGQHS